MRYTVVAYKEMIYIKFVLFVFKFYFHLKIQRFRAGVMYLNNIFHIYIYSMYK